MTRPYLVYCPMHNRQCCADLSGPDRQFDVAVNRYELDANRTYHPKWMPLAAFAAQEGFPLHTTEEVEWSFHTGGYPSHALEQNLRQLPQTYEYYCFLDDDIRVSTDALNRLFAVGKALDLQLYQPALTPDSYCSHKSVLQAENSYVRPCEYVEPMVPFMSQRTLTTCRPTLLQSRSGWGLGQVWAKLLNYQQMAIIDAIPVKHMRPGTTGKMVFPDGSTPRKDREKLYRKYGL